MTQVPLAPPPQTGQPIDGWLFLLWKRLTATGQILWDTISFTGSDLTDIETRNHADLQNLNTASYTHLTATQATDLTDGGTTTLHTHPSGVASSVTVADAASDTTTFLVLSGAATGDQALLTDAGLSYNAATNILTVTGSVSAALNGTVGATTPAAGAFTTLSTTGSVGIGGTPLGSVTLYTAKQITGGTTAYNRLTSCLINPSVTGAAYGDLSSIGTYANGGTPYTITAIIHNSVNQGTLHADSTVTNQYAYQVGASLIGATNNYGFLSQVPVGTGRWNFYAGGTAANYFAGVCQFADGTALLPSITNIGDENTGVWFPAADTVAVSTGGTERMRIDSAGNVGIGTSSTLDTKVRIGGTVVYPASGGSSFGLKINGTAGSGGTSNAGGVISIASTEDAAATYSNVYSYYAQQGTVSGGSRIATTNYYGFIVDSTPVNATNNYGFYSNIVAATGRWNFYAAGSANNAYAGNSSFGQVVAPIAAVDTTSFATNLVTNTGATYTVLTTDHTIIQTTAASVYTLPAASSFTGRILHLVTQFAGTVTSASSNVVPIAGGAAGTAILAATAGKFATLQSDGTNWIIIASN